MIIRTFLAAALLVCLGTTASASTPIPVAVPAVSIQDESERLRADMEGQVERLRLQVQSFMEVQDKRIADMQLYAVVSNALMALLAMVALRFAHMARAEARRERDGDVRRRP